MSDAAVGLRLEGVGVRLGGRVLVPDLHLQVGPGAVAVVQGPSGSGKSSLLAWLAGVLTPPRIGQGRVVLDGRVLDGLPPEHRRIGLMLQDDVLFPHLDVLDNLLFALPRLPGDTRASRRAEAESALARAELAGLGARKPHELSGGQRSRVALVRTLLARPRAVLLDEPFARLDAALRSRMRERVWAALAQAGLPALLVTHDPEDIPEGATVLTLPAAPKED